MPKTKTKEKKNTKKKKIDDPFIEIGTKEEKEECEKATLSFFVN